MATSTNKPQAETMAADLVAREVKAAPIRRAWFWIFCFGIGFGLFLLAMNGLLVANVGWQSLVWLFAFIVLIAPFIYAGRHKVEHGTMDFGNAGIRLVIAFCICLVMLIIIYQLIFSGVAEGFFAWVVGNETLGHKGLAGTFGFIGMLIGLFLTYALPVVLFVLLMRALMDEKLPIIKVVILAILTPLSLILAIGHSLIMKAGL